ncbi:MAG: hypothetical protein QXJ53_01805 [Candidatus Bathyarchaeia archaeon]
MNNKGQFTIIAALFVAVILIATVIMTYSSIRNSPVQNEAQILSAIDETIVALKQVLGFTVGYYGSVLQVTGNNTYARDLALGYFQSGLAHIANMHPEWGASFKVDNINMTTYWFTNSSYSTAYLKVNYSLTGLGIYGISYDTSCKLMVEIGNTTANNQAVIMVKKDEGEAVINLGKDNFKFYRYIYENSTWMPVSPLYDTSIEAYANGTYLINMTDPRLSEIDPYSYVVQVQDPRGLVVVAASFSRYICEINWNETIYQSLKNAVDATIVVELLQNGTMRWLGQNLQLTTQAKPIPPIPLKAIRVNQTINGVNQEVPFQIEDWASDYMVPLSLANNASIFNNRNMLVFLVNPNVTKVIIWWNGSDTATQTPNAYTNRYFTVNTDSSQRTLTNTILNLRISFSDNNRFSVISTRGGFTATAVFMRINQDYAHYGHSEPMYAITNGPVRVVLQHEVEWDGGGVAGGLCPNVYAHIVLTLPANATYYTYQLRLMFLDSQQKRNITDLCPIRITTTSSGNFSALTEDGTSVYSGSGLFYNMSGVWQHHWSQINVSATRGFGIMFTDSANMMLYRFDSIAGNNTGALYANSTSRLIELLPVAQTLNAPANFTYALDVTWYGAVVTFDGASYTPIYKNNGSGLWVLVEYPPTITVTTEN